MSDMTLLTREPIHGVATPGRPRPERSGALPGTDPEIAGPSFRLRAATAQDLAYVRARLPDAVGGTPAATITVATDVATGTIAGVASLRVFVDRVGRFLMFVDPAYRRRGCGTALFEGVRQAALAARVTRVLTGRSSEATADDDATLGVLAFLRARGLAVAQEIVRWRAELKSARGVFEPHYRRLEQVPSGPNRARVVTADQVDPRALAAFVARGIGGYPEEVAARLGGRGPAYCLQTSMVALAGDTIVGAQLTQTRPDEIYVEAKVVAVGHRGGWVNLAMMYRTVAAADLLGIRTIEFEHDACERDTGKLARRLAATPAGRRQCWGCPLPSTEGHLRPPALSPATSEP